MPGPAVLERGTRPISDLHEAVERELLHALRTTPTVALVRALLAVEPAAGVNWLVQERTRNAPWLDERAALKLLIEAARMAASQRDARAATAIAEALELEWSEVPAELVNLLIAALGLDSRVRILGPRADALVARNPNDAGMIRLAVETSLALGDSAKAHGLLNRLGRAGGTPAIATEVMRLRRQLPDAGGAPVRVALLSSFTLDALAPVLDLECRISRLAPELYIAPFNTWDRELRDPRSGLQQFRPDIVFLSAALDDLVPTLAGAPTATELDLAGSTALQRVLEAVRAMRAQADCAVVVHSFNSVYPDGVLTGGVQSRTAWIRGLNAKLTEALGAIPNVFVLDVQDLLSRAPAAGDDARLRHLARMRLAQPVLSDLAKAYVRFIAPWKGLTRKCVVVDLDNTLWGGVIGEDGLSGLRLSDASPGSEFVEFQHYLKSLIERGFVLAIASKNNEADALEVLRTHDAMVLREKDFVAIRANWQPKHQNLRSIAEELGLGLDSMVFVDDNPDERELMRQMLPQVLTVELAPEPALYRRTLEQLPELQVLGITAEDRERTQMYAARRDRESARVSAVSMEEFFESLGITVEVSLASKASVLRVQQLFQRTNQFNLTRRRYDLPTVEARSAAPGWRVFTLKAGDRFSDHGLVATAMVEASGDAWRIDNLVLSCRAIGYGIESALLAHIAAEALAAGARELNGEFASTARNAPAHDFFVRHEFLNTGALNDTQLWSRNLVQRPMSAPAWVSLKVSDDA